MLFLWLLATNSTKYMGGGGIGNFNYNECLGSPHTGYWPDVCVAKLVCLLS